MRLIHDHISLSLAALLLLAGTAMSGTAQDSPPTFRQHFATARQAWTARDTATYLAEMEAAERLVPEGAVDRPTVQYQYARALSMSGRGNEALMQLRAAWEEDVEGMMIFFAQWDEDFSSIHADPEFKAVMRLHQGRELDIEELGGGVYLLTGAGCNVLAVRGEDGFLLVDSGYRQAARAIRSALASIGSGGAAQIINTHRHEDHVGGNSVLGADALVRAHPETATGMETRIPFVAGVVMPERDASAFPDEQVTSVDFDFGGQSVVVRAFPAHTTGDLVVHLPEAGVLAVGDLFFEQATQYYPGTMDPIGHLEGFLEFLSELPGDTRVVGGHDPVAPLSTLRDQVADTYAIVEYVRKQLAEGSAEMDQIIENAPKAWPPRYIRFFHQLLSGAQ